MQIYCVGGAVRDQLLGRAVTDHDWVVTGATPEQMAELGFRPVGRDFPVFLHPQTHEEYALARTERKIARGYRGFQIHSSPEVTLEDDLRRRDLTINAIARAADGSLIDPWGGQADLKARVLRHVSDAFAEDPVRILRLARFAARLPEFTVAADTITLARRMVDAGEVDALVAERVWQELARGLMEDRPSRMIEVLDQCGALERLLPFTIDAARLDAAARCREPLEIRYALLVAGAGPADAILNCSERLRAPGECAALARLLATQGTAQVLAGDPPTILARLEGIDALRRPERARFFARACAHQSAAPASTGSGSRLPDGESAQRHTIRDATCETVDAVEHAFTRLIDAARSVDAGAIAARVQAEGKEGAASRIQRALHEARTRAIAEVITQPDTWPPLARPVPSEPNGDAR